MSKELRGSDDTLNWVLDEVNQARKRKLLGETGPLVAEEHRDKQAEYIDKQIDMITRLADRISQVEKSRSPWYSARGLVESVLHLHLFQDDESLVRSRLEDAAKRTQQQTKKTTQFREQYACIYEAAYYATLPRPPKMRSMRIQNSSILNGLIQLGLDLHFQPPECVQFSDLAKEMDLDAAHQLDRKLVSLSAKMAYVLETTWKNNGTIDPDVCELIYSAGHRYEELLVASQYHFYLRTYISGLLNDVTDIISLLNGLLPESSTDTGMLNLNTKYLFGTSSSSETKMSTFDVMRRLAAMLIDDLSRKVRFFRCKSAKNDMDNSADIDSVNESETTLESVTRRMNMCSDTHKFNDGTAYTDAFTGVAVREGAYARVHKIQLLEKRKLIRNDSLWSENCSIKFHWDFDKVAVKVLNVMHNVSEGALALRILREFTVWSQMQHVNIIPLAGIWFDFQHAHGLPAFVSPWIEDGNLSTYLQERVDLNRKERLHILLGVTKALAYMHNSRPRVCHGDIKPDNILVEGGNALVCDFGISHISVPTGMATDPHGDWKYKAPEQFTDSTARPTPQSDMYSFGLLSYNVLSGLIPWEDDKKTEGDRIVKPYTILPCPDAMTTTDYDLLKYCWRSDPRLRVTANIAVAKLEELIAAAKFEDFRIE